MENSNAVTVVTVVSLAETVASLPQEARRAFTSVFDVKTATSRLTLPPALQPRAAGWFAQPTDTGPEQALARVECQVRPPFKVLGFQRHHPTGRERMDSPTLEACRRFKMQSC
jgi:hypothetical protein